MGPQVYLCAEYDSGGLDIKLFGTAPPGSADDLHLDLW